MKKISIAAGLAVGTLAFTSCQKESVAPTAAKTSFKATVMADKANLGQADFTEDPNTPPVSDKANLGQADFTTTTTFSTSQLTIIDTTRVKKHTPKK